MSGFAFRLVDPPTVRLSAHVRGQMITLKRRTGLTHFNEIGRWALAFSLAQAPVSDVAIPVDVAMEIEWDTFAGKASGLYLDLLCMHCTNAGLLVEQETVERHLRLHLHRGTGLMIGDPALRERRGEQRRTFPLLALMRKATTIDIERAGRER